MVSSVLGVTLPFYGDYPFVPQLLRGLMDFWVTFRVKNDLTESVLVAQINENYPAMVSSGLYPAHERNGADQRAFSQALRRNSIFSTLP